jgi:uncharacterized protein (DUF58 family)
VWAGIGLLILGFLFSNTLIVIPAVVLFAFLLAEGVSFRRVVDVLEHSVTLNTNPKNLETVVGLRCTMETIIENHTDVDIRVVGFHRNLPSEIRQPVFNKELLLPAHGKQRVETVLELRSPGRCEIWETRLAVERRTGLFRQPLALPDHVTIRARPIIGDTNSLPGLGGLHDLASDPNRRGVGTDFAGIRPAHSLEDLHRIDWKATARTGKLMAREFYLERDPPIVLVIDVSTFDRTTDSSFPKRLLKEVAGLVANPELARTAVGLVLYDEYAVIANIEVRSGLENRERILRTLIDKTEHASATTRSMEEASRPYASLAEETRTMERQLTRSGKAGPLAELSASFASRLLPFYRKAISRYLSRLGQKGVFKAFDMISELREPALVIGISNDTTSLDGLYEGARHATMSNHRVIIAILGHPDKTRLTEWLSNSEQMGIRTVLCPPEQLWSAVNAELLQMGRARFKEPAVQRPVTQTT